MFQPTSEDDLASCVRDADGPLKIIGGGTRDYGRPVEGKVLTTSKLSGIRLHEPGALTLVAAAGTPIDEITTVLDENNQQLAFEPMDYRGLLATKGTPTIGGAIAANVSGPRRISVGAARDFLLGVRFVDGAGNIVKNGGRVMKNVTGYDLVKLMAGSHGTLGVLTEVSLKVLPKPESEATLAIEAPDTRVAVRVMSEALGSPFDVSGAAFDSVRKQVFLRIEGFEKSVRYRQVRLAQHLAGFGNSLVKERIESSETWQSIRDVSMLQKMAGDVWRISVKPSDAPQILERLDCDTYQLDWSGGLIWALSESGRDLRNELNGFTGHATLIRASSETRERIPSFHPQPKPLSAIAAGLRAKFDPRRILNQGIML